MGVSVGVRVTVLALRNVIEAEITCGRNSSNDTSKATMKQAEMNDVIRVSIIVMIGGPKIGYRNKGRFGFRETRYLL